MCSIFGVIAQEAKDPNEIFDYTMAGANLLQHRGHEWYGIAYSKGEFLRVDKRPGLIISLPDDRALTGKIIEDQPRMIIFQTRFSTQGGSTKINAQPHYRRLRQGTVALGSNGDVYDYNQERERLEKEGCSFISRNDSEILLQHIILMAKDDLSNIPVGIQDLMRNIPATFSSWLATEKQVYLFRDRFGNRPLYYMRIGGYFIFASEDCALLAILEHRAEHGYKDGTVEINQVLPGEIIRIDLNGEVEYLNGVEPSPCLVQCAFEKVYFTRPDSCVFGSSSKRRLYYKVLVRQEEGDRYFIEILDREVEEIASFRFRLGKQLGIENPVTDADCVISVPQSGDFATLGYCDQTKTRFQIGLIRSAYVSRTFISPGGGNRMRLASLKYRALWGLFKQAQRIVVIDDSIVYATTMTRLVHRLTIAGAKEVHIRVSCPPITTPCRYGIDMSSKGPLPAATMSVEEIRKMLKATSLKYLSSEGLKQVIGVNADNYCYACWDGNYPIHY
ncbi:MAG: hypothetical protein COT24_00130 [Candidatus Kerfeldbacteria bacterium CG08_land_8_20_14_0_20_40_16]|uniref:Amidophosphoribosyltransferase n=1 Tax=Candidatus Kerfeldbacteria bacterium CG08_land_8_20_14_0_20_40_16 TaxID=2014244 RepID=A0A2H0YZD2_9BACT|nr:MAG: hypothetical protein COT24_00130 [Candidatus Kerfeldbacteria bacterium CG08_land_8_20_14_0_20_40_16]